MVKLGPAGRGGRGGRNTSHYYDNPKYLSNPPTKLPFKAPDLSSNPYYFLQKQYNDGPTSITSSLSQSNPTTPSPQENANANGWKFFLNHRRSLRKKASNKLNLSFTYNKLQRLSLMQTQTDPNSTNKIIDLSSHNPRDLSQNMLQATSEPTSEKKHPQLISPSLSPVIDMTANETTTIISNMDEPMSPPDSLLDDPIIDANMTDVSDDNDVNVITQPNIAVDTPNPSEDNINHNPGISTPTKTRRSKKSKAKSSPPVTTPSKRGKSSTDTVPESPTPPIPSAPADDGTTTTPDDDLSNMTTASLLKEVFRMTKETGHAVSEDAFKNLAPSVLLSRAREYRASIAAKRSATKEKPGLIPIIKFDIADHVIDDLDAAKARSVFMSCLRKQKNYPQQT